MFDRKTVTSDTQLVATSMDVRYKRNFFSVWPVSKQDGKDPGPRVTLSHLLHCNIKLTPW